MNIQVMIKTPAPQSAANEIAGKANTSSLKRSSGKSFADVFEKQAPVKTKTVSGGGAQEDRTESLLGSLQNVMSSMPSQQVPLNNTGGQVELNSAIQALLQKALNKNTSTAGQMLQDPKLQQWFAQAANQLSLLGTKDGGQLSFILNMLDGAQSPQDTLLQPVSAAGQQPESPAFQQLLNVLKSAIEPQALQSIVIQGGGQEQRLQQTISGLEVLAAKSSGITSPLPEQLFGGNGADSGESDSPTGDSSFLQTPTPPLQDLLKTLGQTGQIATEVPQGTVNAQSFVRDMSRFMANNMKLSLGDTLKEASISLHPEQLGQVDVKITLHANGQLVAQFAANTNAGRQLLESELPQLKQALQSQGLQVHRLEVAGEQAGASGMFQQHQQSNGGRSFERNTRRRITEPEAIDNEFANGLHKIAELRQDVNEASSTAFDTTA